MIGILGGSFDPVHNGHIMMANYAKQHLSLSEVLFIPCKIHAFAKHFQTTEEQRLAMLNLALQDYPQFKIDERELHNQKTSYMYDTVTSLQRDYPNQEFALLLGADVASEFTEWYEWKKLLEKVTLVIFQRKDKIVELPERANNKIIYLTNPVLNISSTEIRHKVAAGESVANLLPDTVLKYIQTEKLYESKKN